MTSRGRGLLALAAVVAVLGCSDSAPRYDPAVAYTPDSLAAELSFRYGSLPPDARNATTAPKARPRGPVEQRKNEATKEALAENLGTVLADIINKAESITATSPAITRGAVADRIARDPTIADEHKKTIIDALRRAP